jgi:hypothetical protein
MPKNRNGFLVRLFSCCKKNGVPKFLFRKANLSWLLLIGSLLLMVYLIMKSRQRDKKIEQALKQIPSTSKLKNMKKLNLQKTSALAMAFLLLLMQHLLMAQNVGIGTTNPQSKLHINGNVKIDSAYSLEFGAGIITKELNAGKIGYQLFTPSALDILGAGTNGTNRKIKFWNEGSAEFAGNIGIGVANATSPLQFAATLRNRKIALWDGFNNDHRFLGFGVNGGMLRYQVGAVSDNHVFFAGTNDSTSKELMRITGTGNVGIGTASPLAKLHVNGNVKIDSAYSLEFGAKINNKDINAGKIGYELFTVNALDIVGAGSNGTNRSIKFWNEAGAEFTGSITVNGNVNMGLVSLQYDYIVQGNTYTSYTLPCPTGTQLITGGGGHRDFNNAVSDIFIRYSGPDINNPLSAWRLIVSNNSGSNRTVRIYCNCARIN